VRPAESDGVTQGTLAVPSLLAALVVADPAGGWLPWFGATCSAAAATLLHLRREMVHSSGGSGSSGGAGRRPADSGADADADAATDAKRGAAAAAGGGRLTRARVRVRADACNGSSGGGGSGSGSGEGAPGRVPAGDGGANGRGTAGAAGDPWGGWAPLAWAVALVAAALAAAAGVWGSGGGGGTAAAAFAVAAAAAAPGCFHGLMGLLPHTLSLGEASLLTQGALLAAAAAAAALPAAPAFATGVARAFAALGGGGGGSGSRAPGAAAEAAEAAAAAGAGAPSPDNLLMPFVSLLIACVLALSAAAWAATSSARLPAPARPSARRAWAAALAAAATGGTALLAAWTLAVFLPARPGRLLLLGYWGAVLAAALPLMHAAAGWRAVPQVRGWERLPRPPPLWRRPGTPGAPPCSRPPPLGSRPTPPPNPPPPPPHPTPPHPHPHSQIILRKGYHLIAAALFLPAFFWDPPMLGASLAIAFAALGAAEVARVTGAPLVGAAVQEFMQVGRRGGGVGGQAAS
jgi:hypothetical protein